jgi:two-component system NtrC family sensor kinase
MKWYSRLGLKGKFFLFTSVIVIAICAGLFFFMETIFRSYLKSELQQQALEIAAALENEVSNFSVPERAQLTAERLLSESREVSRIVVYRRAGNVLEPFIKAEAQPFPDNVHLYSRALSQQTAFQSEFQFRQKEYWDFVYPILSRGRVVGLTAVTMNFAQFKILVSALRMGTLLILLLGLVVMLVSMNLYVEVTIRRPLAEIVRAMELVKQSRFDTKLTPHGQDEIGLLARDFGEMTVALGEAQEEAIRQNRLLEQRVREATAELRSRNLELFEAQDELRRASRLATAGQVAAMLAHDLGSPLSSISGHLQLMLEDRSRNTEEMQRLQLILDQVERLSDTIRNFLRSVGRLETHFQNTDLNALLEHLVQLTSPVFSERKIEPVLETDQKIPAILADPHQLQQLFLNLFTNAIDAMKDGGQLRVKTEQDNSTVRVLVSDTGIGMSPQYLKHLFRPFFSTKEFGKGTGLGLAICKEIVKSHGGQITVESNVGQGTEFTILFPLGGPNEKTEPADRG